MELIQVDRTKSRGNALVIPLKLGMHVRLCTKPDADAIVSKITEKNDWYRGCVEVTFKDEENFEQTAECEPMGYDAYSVGNDMMYRPCVGVVPSCDICHGHGWCWRHELPDVSGWDGGHDDTKYMCSCLTKYDYDDE